MCVPVSSHSLTDFGAALHGILDERQNLRIVAVGHHVTQIALRCTWQVPSGFLCRGLRFNDLSGPYHWRA